MPFAAWTNDEETEDEDFYSEDPSDDEDEDPSDDETEDPSDDEDETEDPSDDEIIASCSSWF